LQMGVGVDALAPGQQGFGAVVAIAEMRGRDRQPPFAIFIGAPTQEGVRRIGGLG